MAVLPVSSKTTTCSHLSCPAARPLRLRRTRHSSPLPPSLLSTQQHVTFTILFIPFKALSIWHPQTQLGHPSSHHNIEFFIITIVINLSKSLKDKMSDVWNSLLYSFWTLVSIIFLPNITPSHYWLFGLMCFIANPESIIMDRGFAHPGVLCFSSTVTVTKIAGQASIIGRAFMMIFKGVKWKPSSYYCQQRTLPWCYAAVQSLVYYVDYVSRCYKETSKVHFYAELRWSFWCFETAQIAGMVVDKCL